MARPLGAFLRVALLVLPLLAGGVQAQTVFAYSSVDGDWLGGGATGSFTPATASFSAYITSEQHVSVTVSTSEGSWDMEFAVPKGQRLAPGRFTDAERAPFRTGRSAGLAVYAPGRGCNQTWGSFNIRQIEQDADGELVGFEADFVHRCESPDAPPLAGVIRWKLPQMSLTLDGALLAQGVPKSFYGDTSLFDLYGDPDYGLAYYGSGRRQNWWLSITPPLGKRLKVGQYVTNSEPTATRAGMAISGLSRCWTTTGKLDIKRMTVTSDGTVSALYATFEQRCAGIPGSITGTIHYRL